MPNWNRINKDKLPEGDVLWKSKYTIPFMGCITTKVWSDTPVIGTPEGDVSLNDVSAYFDPATLREPFTGRSG